MIDPGVDTLLIVDDHPVVRHGVAALLRVEAWAGPIVEGASVAAGRELATRVQPAVAVVDLGLPDGDGRELIREIRRVAPGCVVLVLTLADDDGVVRSCLAAGASGYLLKDSPPQALVRAVQTVIEGGLVLGPGVRTAAIDPARPSVRPPLDRLSPQDLRLLTLLGRGESNAQIARMLGVSDKTVRNRVSQVLATIGAVDRVGAALMARDHGLT